MRIPCTAMAALVCSFTSTAWAQTSFMAPDGKNRFPGVTVFCPNGTGVVPCNFGGGGGASGTVSINLGGGAVSYTNKFPVFDSALEALISGGALKIGGAVTISGTPAVSVGSVSVSNLPATQAVSGAVSVTALPPLPTGTNIVGTVNLAAGAVGSVTAGGTGGSVAMAVQGIAGGTAMPVTGAFWQTTQPVSAASLPLPAGAATAAAQTAVLAPVAPGTATATQSVVVGCLANTTLPSFSAGQQGAVPCDTSGRLYVVTVPSANNVPGYLQAVSAGGASTFSAVNSAVSCMATAVKASSGMVFAYALSNTNGSGVWVRLFASGTAPSCGSGTPAKRIYVPAGATVSLSTDLGWVFAGGIGFDVTSGSGADADATTVATANSVLVNIDYK